MRRDPGSRHRLFDKSFPLQPRTWDKVATAMRNVRSRTGRPTPGQVIAELTLGFWRFTASGYRQTVWMNYLSHAVPHAPRRPQAAVMDRQFDRIIKLRNRIAHHEPIGPVSDVCVVVDDIMAIGSWISPVMADWWSCRTAARRVLVRPPM